MIIVKRYSILGIVFLALFVIGIQFLEWMESSKVIPFEHVQIGFTYSLFMGCLFFIGVYLPLTIIMDFLPFTVTWNIVKIVVYSLVGSYIGSYLFFITYSDWVEVDGYNVQKETSIIIFAIVSIIYTISSIIYKNSRPKRRTKWNTFN